MSSPVGSSQRLRGRRTAAFVVSFLAVSWYALRGGSFDTPERGENAVLLWFGAGAAAAVGLLPRTRMPRGGPLVLALLALLVAWMALGLRWSDSDERTWQEIARLVGYAGVVAVAWTAVGRGTWRAAAGGLVAGALLVSALAVLSRLWPDLLSDDVPDTLGRDRLSYPFDYWNAVSAWGAMSLCMALAWSAHARRRELRALLLAAAPLCALAVYLTYSRAGVIAAAIAVVAAVALSRNRWTCAAHALVTAGAAGFAIAAVRSEPAIARATGGDGGGKVAIVLLVAAAVCAAAAATLGPWGLDALRLPRRAAGAALAAGCVLAALTAATVLADPVSDAWEEFRTSDVAPRTEDDPASRLGSSSGTRYRIWTAAVDSWEADARGTGAGTFEFWWNRTEGGEHVLDAHSLYLESLAEIGSGGFALVVAFLLALAALALRARPRLERDTSVGANAALLGGFAVFAFYAGVDWMWEVPAVAVLALGAAALAAAARGAPEVDRSLPRRLALVGCAVVACLVQAPGIASTEALRDSREAYARGDGEEAARRATDAVDAQPWAASPYVQRGLVAEAGGRLDAAAADLRRAVEREPLNWRPYALLARVEAARGNARAALEQFRRARSLVKDSAFFDAGAP